jgi:hypothetical protein
MKVKRSFTRRHRRPRSIGRRVRRAEPPPLTCKYEQWTEISHISRSFGDTLCQGIVWPTLVAKKTAGRILDLDADDKLNFKVVGISNKLVYVECFGGKLPAASRSSIYLTSRRRPSSSTHDARPTPDADEE